ncbi:odorant receptor 4-like [Pieris brassicae]|uniref:odorant receptor 4-like n=1 Tax=Pieris brassicae TaxID=7116 RepID=UPI001E65E2FB|nr:odorant receptor 4-like [Pieris brassicae]
MPSLRPRDEVLSELNFIRYLTTKIFLYPFIGRSKLAMIGYVLTTFLVLSTTLQLLITIVSANTSEWLAIINAAPNLGVCVMSAIKYTNIQMHTVRYNQIFLHFHDEMWDVVTNSDIHRKIIRYYKKLAMVFNRFLLYYSIPLIIVVDSFPYIVMRFEERFLGIKEYLYPFEAWYPFDKIKFYGTAYIWESCMTAVVVSLYVITNMIHSTYIIFTCMELRILGNCLEELISDEDVDHIRKGVQIEEIYKRSVRRIKMIISRHDVLAKQIAALDTILGDAMIINYSLGAVFICLTAFTSTVLSNFYKRVRYSFMCLSLIVECFIQCFMGQIISDHSKNLTNSIYSSNWPYASPETKTIMLMFMMRTQKPFVLSAKGYIAMNMHTFSCICSTSYQLFNLLRTIYAKKNTLFVN